MSMLQEETSREGKANVERAKNMLGNVLRYPGVWFCTMIRRLGVAGICLTETYRVKGTMSIGAASSGGHHRGTYLGHSHEVWFVYKRPFRKCAGQGYRHTHRLIGTYNGYLAYAVYAIICIP
jgi:hypothetical protein